MRAWQLRQFEPSMPPASTASPVGVGSVATGRRIGDVVARMVVVHGVSCQQGMRDIYSAARRLRIGGSVLQSGVAIEG